VCANSLPKLSSREAIVIAVGSPAPTSLANVGPDSTAVGLGPRTSRATSCGNSPVDSSKPFVAQATRVSGCSFGASSASVARNACEGTATSTSREQRSAKLKSDSTISAGGKSAPGK